MGRLYRCVVFFWAHKGGGVRGGSGGLPPHSPAPPLTLQACASSRAAVSTSLGFSITRPVHPEKSMATRALSETLRCEGQGGHWRVPTGQGLQGAGDTHQGRGADPGGLVQPCLCLLVVAIELHPVLGEQPHQLGGRAAGWGSTQGHPGTSTATQCRGGDPCIHSTWAQGHSP